MRCVSVISLLAALSCTVSAGPTMNPERALAMSIRADKGTFTLGDKKAPFQDVDSLPALNGADAVDLDLKGYEQGYSTDSDQYKCHGSAGLLFRIRRTKQSCEHPYFEPMLRFAFQDCKDVPDFSPYLPIKAYKTYCYYLGGAPWIDF